MWATAYQCLRARFRSAKCKYIFFVGTIDVIVAEYNFKERCLLLANSANAAAALLDKTAAGYFDDAELEARASDDWYEFRYGEVRVRASGIEEVGRATGLELSGVLPLFRDASISLQKLEVCEPELGTAATSIRNLLAAKGVEVGQNVMLHALAGALGAGSWHSLKKQLASKISPVKLSEAFEFEPVTLNCKDGPEMSLLGILKEHYWTHGIPGKQVEVLAKAYVATWVEHVVPK